ncbi:MAG: cytochrome c biogenesis protein CcdA [Candidatus Gastranaerophilaceae bacterium]
MNNYLEMFSQGAAGSGHFGLIMLGVSFLGGLLASVSPCSLAMLPIIIGYVGGYSKGSPAKTFLQMLFFVFGSSLVFATIGVICAVTGKVFISFAPVYFILILASLLMVMGLNIMGLLDFNMPVIIKQIPQSSGKNMVLYPILIGAVFALAGTPCSTPILAGIMAFASMSTNILSAVLMLFMFSLGQGLILVIAGVFTSSLKGFKNFAYISEILLKLSGVLLILSSLYIFYKVFSPLL